MLDPAKSINGLNRMPAWKFCAVIVVVVLGLIIYWRVGRKPTTPTKTNQITSTGDGNVNQNENSGITVVTPKAKDQSKSKTAPKEKAQ